jgi:hypothetical protein
MNTGSPGTCGKFFRDPDDTRSGGRQPLCWCEKTARAGLAREWVADRSLPRFENSRNGEVPREEVREGRTQKRILNVLSVMHSESAAIRPDGALRN